MAKVAGVVKTNTSVFPEKRGDGMCARMETRYESVKVFGLVDIEVIAAAPFSWVRCMSRSREQKTPSDVTIRSAFLQEAESVAV